MSAGGKSGKIWGQTELLLETPLMELHRIMIDADGFCSTHKHSYKHNLFYVVHGTLEVSVHKNDYDLVDVTLLTDGEYMTVSPGEYHSFRAVTDVEALEIYYPEPIGKDIQRKSVGGIPKQKTKDFDWMTNRAPDILFGDEPDYIPLSCLDEQFLPSESTGSEELLKKFRDKDD